MEQKEKVCNERSPGKSFSTWNSGQTGKMLQSVVSGADGVSQEERRNSGQSWRSKRQDTSGRNRFSKGHQAEVMAKLGRGSEEHRHWICATREPAPTEERLVIVSYNILGVDNAVRHWRELYFHIPPSVMDWNQRKCKILQEIGLWSPDVLCLQEVDRFEELQEDLGQRKYAGIFKGRTGVATDGCAIFWKEERFCFLHEESIEYRDMDLRDNVAQLCVLQFKHKKVAETGRQESEEKSGSRSCILVCNIHVLFNPNGGDIKIGQVRVLLEKAHALSEKWGGIPVVIAGDFNSTPQSAVYRFMSCSELDVSRFERWNISGQLGAQPSHSRIQSNNSSLQKLPSAASNKWRWATPPRCHQLSGTSGKAESSTSKRIQKQAVEQIVEQMGRSSMQTNALISQNHQLKTSRRANDRAHGWSLDQLEAATGSTDLTVVRHPLKLRSAYSSIECPGDERDSTGEPLVTTYHQKFMGTVDYIWYSEGLVPARVLDTLPCAVLQRTRGLPSKKWGSDHLALACELAITAYVACLSKEEN